MKGFLEPRRLRKEIFNPKNENTYPTGNRKVDTGIKHDSNNVICTTYFTGKDDPQHQIRHETDNIDYIQKWYESIVAQNLSGLVFYDELSDDFINKYSNANIKFVQCTLGDYSLNDERFIIYNMYFQEVPYEKIYLTDGNDVAVNSNTMFDEISSDEIKLYIGRGKDHIIMNSFWNKQKLATLKEGLNEIIPDTLYYMPVLNAGVIGGNYNVVMFFLKMMNAYFFKLNNNENNNMSVMHLVTYYYFYYSSFNALQRFFIRNPVWFFRAFKSKHFLKLIYPFDKNIRRIKNRKVSTLDLKYLKSGYPIVSLFYEFEEETDAHFIHK